jgi:DNA-binding MarR family transcriptional regulator
VLNMTEEVTASETGTADSQLAGRIGAAESRVIGETGTIGNQVAGKASQDDPAVDAWRGLLVAHSRLVPLVEADLRAAGQIALSWYDVLLELNAAPERRLRMSELGQRVVLSRTRVSRIMDELAAAGLAERQPDPADGRSSFAALTPAGRDALRRAWPVYREAIRRHLAAGLTVPQCRELATLLDQVIKASEAASPLTV